MDLYFNKIKMDVEQVIYIIGRTVGIGIWIGLVLYCISENRKDRK